MSCKATEQQPFTMILHTASTQDGSEYKVFFQSPAGVDRRISSRQHNPLDNISISNKSHSHFWCLHRNELLSAKKNVEKGEHIWRSRRIHELWV